MSKMEKEDMNFLKGNRIVLAVAIITIVMAVGVLMVLP